MPAQAVRPLGQEDARLAAVLAFDDDDGDRGLPERVVIDAAPLERGKISCDVAAQAVAEREVGQAHDGRALYTASRRSGWHMQWTPPPPMVNMVTSGS